MEKIRTHYDNLKVQRSAPLEVIRAAYKALAMKHHPDKNSFSEESTRVMKIINASYEVLNDPSKRLAHDRWIAESEAALQAEIEKKKQAERASYHPPTASAYPSQTPDPHDSEPTQEEQQPIPADQSNNDSPVESRPPQKISKKKKPLAKSTTEAEKPVVYTSFDGCLLLPVIAACIFIFISGIYNAIPDGRIIGLFRPGSDSDDKTAEKVHSPQIRKAAAAASPNQKVIAKPGYRLEVPVRFENQSSYHCLAKLIDPRDGKEVITVLLPIGDSVATKAPTGHFFARFAFGLNWQDADALFGNETVFRQTRIPISFKKPQGKDSEVLITVRPDRNASPPTTSISKSEF